MEIRIKTIPHSDQRYPTCGDYWYDSEGVLQIRVSDLGDEMFESMIAIHELIEERLTKRRGLTEPEIMEFDLAFEKARALGLRKDDEEPGFAENCPYRNEHSLATACEMLICAQAGISWNEYSYQVNQL